MFVVLMTSVKVLNLDLVFLNVQSLYLIQCIDSNFALCASFMDFHGRGLSKKSPFSWLELNVLLTYDVSPDLLYTIAGKYISTIRLRRLQ